MSYASLDDLRSQLGGQTSLSPAYIEKMLHEVPATVVKDRRVFLLERTKGKKVLEFGASGPMHEAIKVVADSYVGVDREDGDKVLGFDLDDATLSTLPLVDSPDVIVCGEVLEHLSNPGWFLTRLKRQYPGVPVIITVPNAHSKGGDAWFAKGVECVNRDHVAWYSWKTLSVLTSRAGYEAKEFYWYNGKPLVAEGLIMVVE